MDIQTLLTGTGSFGVMIGAVLTFLRSARGRRAVAAFFDESFGLNDKIDAAVDIAVAILKAEIANLQAQITELKTSDTAKSARIAELEAEVIVLRAENESLRAELQRRRGGRPRKDATPVEGE